MKRVVAPVVLALAACGAPPTTYTAETQSNFMRACTTRAASASYCTCMYGKVSQQLPRADFDAYERMSEVERRASPFERRLTQFAQECGPAQSQP